MSNSLSLDQARQFVGPDLVPNCFQSLSAEDTSRQRVKGEFLNIRILEIWNFHTCMLLEFLVILMSMFTVIQLFDTVSFQSDPFINC